MEKEEVVPYYKEIIEKNFKENFDLSKVVSYTLNEIDEYIVTLKDANDLEQFYDDLETPGGTECVPDRCVECALRRPISRNTHYHLTQEEAELLKQDDRVIDVIAKKLKDSAINHPVWTQTSSNWDKSTTPVNTHRNWGLKRSTDGLQTSNWGSNGTAAISGTVVTTSSGKNVDVIIVDGFIDPNHPEMAANEDGTGGTRVNQFNWYSLNSIILGTANGTYPYPTDFNIPNSGNNDHGMHVAGTACGNSQGWARDANVYNLYPYAGPETFPGSGIPDPLYPGSNYWIDYIRAFHLTKPINPQTGLRNPTIINNSWGSSRVLIRSEIDSITWRGTTYTSPFTDAELLSFGILFFNENYIGVSNADAVDFVDMQDAINDGVIFVGAAGNSYTKIDVPGGQDYDNSINGNLSYYGGYSFYYHRGSTNTSGANAICVGAIDSLINDRKTDFSNSGPRIDVYSPGASILSSVDVSGPQYYNSTLTTPSDYRNSNFYIDKYGGTSMASPQVCGVLACALEQYPRMTHAEAVEYIQNVSKSSQVYDPRTSGIFNNTINAVCNTTTRISGTEKFFPFANTSYTITTTSTVGTATTITNSLGGSVGLTSSTTPTSGNNDDGYWTVSLPFNISYNGASFNQVFVGTNSYITFGSGSTEFASLSFTNPALRKIMISARDNSCQIFWRGVQGTAPNRTYRIRYEGTAAYTGTPGSPNMVWEAIFYENTPNKIDIHVGVNAALNPYVEFYDLQGSVNKYLFYRKDRPTQGTILPRVGEKVRKTTGQTWPRMGTLRYKQS